jgi:hypothetical protein
MIFAHRFAELWCDGDTLALSNWRLTGKIKWSKGPRIGKHPDDLEIVRDSMANPGDYFPAEYIPELAIPPTPDSYTRFFELDTRWFNESLQLKPPLLPERWPEAALACNEAVYLASVGPLVFPCHENKKPATPNGFRNATRSQLQIRWMWHHHPGLLVGLCTGVLNGVDVLDLDTAKHPEAAAWLTSNLDKLGKTLTVETRSGGMHLFFKHRPGLKCSASKIVRGVDVRANGGYVIAWALHGCRIITDAPIAEWPAFLVETLNPANSEPTLIFSQNEQKDDLAWLATLSADEKNSLIESLLFSIDNSKIDPYGRWRDMIWGARDAFDRGADRAREIAMAWSARGTGFSGDFELFDKIWDNVR